MSQAFFKKMGITAAVFAGVWLGIRYLFPLVLPFLLALLLALAAEPLVSSLHQRLHIPRSLSAGIGVTVTLALLLLLLLVLGAVTLRQLRTFAGILPGLAQSAMDGMESLELGLLDLAAHAPEQLRPMLSRSVQTLFTDSTALLDSATGLLLGLASGIVTRIPDSLFGIGTWILACYMTSAKLPQVRRFLHRAVPSKWKAQYLPTLQKLKHALGGWLGAQLRLAGITLVLLCLGLYILQIPRSFLWAFLIALLDALPVFGTGTALVPWSLICFWEGDHIRGIGLLGVYACITLVRSVLEPKLVGKQLGLDPLITLAAMYAGYQIWGIGGMLLAPLLAVLVAHLLPNANDI